MLRNYFNIALRNLAKQKGLAFINIFGLAAGIACFVLFLLYTVNEFSFDRFHRNGSNIFRVYECTKPVNGEDPSFSVSMPMPLGPAMKKDLKDVVAYMRMRGPMQESLLRVGGEVFRGQVSFADAQFFSFFSFRLLQGNPRTALQNMNSLVITESKAKELFGNLQAVGQTLQIKIDGAFQPFVISAVAVNVPVNSSIRFDILGNFDFFATTSAGTQTNNWYTTSYRTYVQLFPGSLLPRSERLLSAFHNTYDPEANSARKDKPLVSYGLQPLRAIHTDSRVADSAGMETIDPRTLWIIMTIAGGVLLIACINFTTLAVGRSAGRSKEIGVRKVAGAEKKQLLFQFLVESFLISFFSTGLGLLLVQLLLPYFNHLAGRELQFSFVSYPEMAWWLAGLILIVALLSGAYPAYILSNVGAIQAIKNKIRMAGSNWFTKSLVGLQFTVSIGLIISTIIIVQQTRYMTGKNPGFNKENVIIVDASQTDSKSVYPLFREALLRQPGISAVGAADRGLGEGSGLFDHGFMYQNVHKVVYEYWVDPGYLHVMGMHLIAGRNFNPTIASDTTTSVIVNEAMVTAFGWTLANAVGQQVKGYTHSKTPVVIGVVKNFNFQPLTQNIEPQLFNMFPGQPLDTYIVRIKPGNPETVIANIQKVWKQLNPPAPFKYSFLDEDIDRFYKSEVRWSKIVGAAGGVAIFLACLGLLGLTALALVNRTKEIGIRKILGASFVSIAGLMSKEFIKLIGISFVLASPLAWYFMKRWLQDYPDRVQIEWWVFAVAGGATMLIAIFLISFQAIKAAFANPVKSLRAE